MQYLDFELEIEHLSRQDYRVVARSPAGEARATMRLPFDEMALKLLLKDVQIALLRSSGMLSRSVSPEEQKVRDFGQQVFEALISGDVRARYDVSTQMATQRGQGLRLKLCLLTPEMATLPWEYLFDQRQGKYLCLSRQTPLVRTLALAHPIQPLKVAPPLRILAMAADPSDLDRLDIAREEQRMREALHDLEARGLVQLQWLPGQTWRDLDRAMRGGPWHIFHFIGHGGFDPRTNEGVLALVNESGTSHLLSARRVALLLEGHPFLRLAWLNACEGAQGSEHDLFASTAATLVREGIPAVLAMQYPITDAAAIKCTRAFYEALAEGLPVDEAVTNSRRAIYLDDARSLEWGTPILYLRAPDGLLFDLAEQPLPNPALLLDRDALVEEARELEKQFQANSYTGSSNGPDILEIKGNLPVVLSAPHAVRRGRKHQKQPPQVYTGALALQLASLTGASALVYARTSDEDPNRNEPGLYKPRLAALIRETHACFVLDFHGSDEDFVREKMLGQVELGTAYNRSLRGKRFLRNILEETLEGSGITVTIDKYFTADESGTITRYASEVLEIPAIQLEITRSLRDVDHAPQKYALLLEALRNAILAMYADCKKETRS